jgi:hypothetical protein
MKVPGVAFPAFTWKQQGYGSGIIERAVAVVINRRMKSGA